MRTFVAYLALCSTALAGNCPQVFVKKQAVILQQAYAYPVVQYAVGQNVQQEAIIEAAVSKALARFSATTVTERTITTTQASVGHQASVQGGASASWQLQHCGKCHTGASAKGGFRVDVEMSCEDRLHAISMMLHDDEKLRMPRGAPLSAQDIGLGIQALSAGLPARATNVPPPPPMPEGQP